MVEFNGRGWTLSDAEAAEIATRTFGTSKSKLVVLGEPHENTLLVLPCDKCGEPMPPMPAAIAGQVRSRGAILKHGVCPADTPVAPAGRRFEAHVTIREVFPVPDDDPPPPRLFFDFLVADLADDLDAALPRLAEQLGVKWQKAMEHARIADTPEPDPRTGS